MPNLPFYSLVSNRPWLLQIGCGVRKISGDGGKIGFGVLQIPSHATISSPPPPDAVQS
uniref:Uncharacterized protein n=1 Tax=Setaria italica TaxID=4555 RepID=K4ANP7_SETIT